MARAHPRLLNIFLVIISLTFCFVLLEISLTLFFPQFNPAGRVVYYRNEDGVMLGKKNSSGRQWNSMGDFNVSNKFNSNGLRDQKDLSSSTENDIFVVGDSFAFGYGVEEDKRFSNLLEQMIKMPVYNLGVCGADFDGYEKMINYAQKMGGKIKKLIITVCMDNDIRDYSKRNGSVDELFPETPVKRKVKTFLESRFTTYNVLAYASYQSPFLHQIKSFLGIFDEPLDIKIYLAQSESVIKSSIDKLRKLCEKKKCIIVIIPSSGLWRNGNQIKVKEFHNKFLEYLMETDINYLDIRPVIEHKEPLSAYFKHDGHLNEEGHWRTAVALQDYLYRTNYFHNTDHR